MPVSFQYLQTIFAQAKFLQLKYPDQFKEMFIMFGCMRMEKALWSCVLESSGWEMIFIQAKVAESGTAD